MAKTQTGVRGLYLKHGRYVYQPPQVRGVRPPRVHLRTSDLGEALQLMQDIKDRGTVAAKAAPTASLAEEFRRAKQASGEHRSGYTTRASASALRRLGAHLGSTPPQAVGAVEILAWRNAMLSEELSRASVASYMRAAQSFFTWLEESGRIARSPFGDLPKRAFPQSIPTRRDQYCTKDQRDRLIAECQDPDLKAVLFLGFHAGLRRAEILAVRPHWIATGPDGAPTHIRVQNEAGADGTQPFSVKDGQPKVVPISRPLAGFLTDYGFASRSPYLIKPHHRHGKSLYRWDWKRAFKTYVTAKGLPWVGAHTMRHTFITLLLSAPPDKRPSILHLARWTGNGIGVLMKSYAHLIDDPDLINAAN